jgi:hypothetical protein
MEIFLYEPGPERRLRNPDEELLARCRLLHRAIAGRLRSRLLISACNFAPKESGWLQPRSRSDMARTQCAGTAAGADT